MRIALCESISDHRHERRDDRLLPGPPMALGSDRAKGSGRSGQEGLGDDVEGMYVRRGADFGEPDRTEGGDDLGNGEESVEDDHERLDREDKSGGHGRKAVDDRRP